MQCMIDCLSVSNTMQSKVTCMDICLCFGDQTNVS